jgi:hypothetical protein
MLRILQWQKKQRGDPGERWILKTPQHLDFLEDFCQVFPDALIIQTHRDPLFTLPSAASMFSALWSITSDDVDRSVVGRQVRNRLSVDLARCLEFRQHQLPGRLHDVWYEDMQSDPIAELERIYAWLDTPFPLAARSVVEAWLAQNARDKRPAHRYCLEEFGLEVQDLETEFADYRARFILGRPG